MLQAAAFSTTPPPSDAPPPPSPMGAVTRLHFAMGQGVSIATAEAEGEEPPSEKWALRLRPMAQLRNVTSFAGATTNALSVGAVRLLLEGRAFDKRLVFSVLMGLSTDEVDGGSGLLDAWLSWKFGRDATLRVGQQRVIYDMISAVVRSGYLGITRERFASEFGMSRDVGAALYSEDFLGMGGLLAYRVGVYGGQGRNRAEAKRFGLLYMARLTLRPFGYFEDTVEGDVERLERVRLAVGLSGAYQNHVARTGGQSGEGFDSFAFPAMHVYYANADIMLKWRGLYVAGQYTRRASTKAFVENGSQRIWGRSGEGYVVKAAYMLTSWLEGAGRWGGQFGARRTEPGLAAFPKHEFAVGLNAYCIGHALKVQAEYAARFSEAKVLYEHWLRLQMQVVF
ncbi:MAG: hypothetical protein FWB81_06430 [Cystobacterineae bacterium]|nr:hypothetical protein [Cystobacterineae bacterium]